MSRSITKHSRSVYGVPNGIQVTDEGIWVVDQLTDRHDVAPALAQADRLAAPLERNDLVDDEGEPLRRDAECVYCRLHVGDVAVVVGPEHVDNPVEAPLYELIVVVADICAEVGGSKAATADHDNVFTLPEQLRREPARAVALDDVAVLLKQVNRGIELTIFEQ